MYCYIGIISCYQERIDYLYSLIGLKIIILYISYLTYYPILRDLIVFTLLNIRIKEVFIFS